MSQTKKPEICNRIIDSARREFLQKGFEKASMRSIAENAGITPGNIYTYFENKNSLFETIVEPFSAEFFRDMEASMAGFKESLDDMAQTFSKETALKVIDRQLDRIYSNYDAIKLLLFHSKGSSMENFKNDVIEKYTSLCLSLLEAIARKQGSKRRFSALSVHMILSLFFTRIEEIIIYEITQEEAWQYRHEWTGIIHGAWNGLINYQTVT